MTPLRTLAALAAVALASPALAPDDAVAWPGNVICDSKGGLGETFVAGLNCRKFDEGGEERRYVAWVSDVAAEQMLAGRSVPQVTMLHGSGGKGEEFHKRSGWSAKADEVGMVAVYPTGVKYLIDADVPAPKLSTRWSVYNLADEVDEVATPLRDDIGFLDRVTRDVGASARIDAKRTYVAGFSNGASMCLRAAIEMAQTFAAAGCHVGGLAGVRAPAPGAPRIPVFSSVGNRDRNLLPQYQAAVNPAAVEVPLLPRLWNAIAVPGRGLGDDITSFGLATSPSQTIFLNRKRLVLRWATPLAGVTGTTEFRYTIFDDLEHAYPHGPGKASNPHGFTMTEPVYRFFAENPKP